MCKGWRVATLSLILLISTTLCGKLAHADSTPASSIAGEERLKVWLAASGFAHKLDYIRIGVGPHPDPKFALDGMIQHWELRFVTAGSNPTEEASRFEQLLADYQRNHSIALSEKLLYQFTDAFELEPQNACVDLHVLDNVFYIYLSRSDGSLAVSKTTRAAFDTFSITIPTVAPQEQFRTHMGKQSAPDSNAMRNAVEKFLRAYLASIQPKDGPAPEIITDVHRQDGFLRMFVNGAKGVVTEYWEWMDIAVLFHPHASAGNAQDSQWDFVSNVEVKYASGPRETHPKDADMDYASRMAQFRTQLNQQLQANLERGIHD